LADGLERAETGRHALLEKEAEEVAVERTNLLADHDVDAELGVLPCPLARPERAADLVVVGDGHDVDAPGRRLENGLGALGAIAPEGVHVQATPSARTH